MNHFVCYNTHTFLIRRIEVLIRARTNGENLSQTFGIVFNVFLQGSSRGDCPRSRTAILLGIVAFSESVVSAIYVNGVLPTAPSLAQVMLIAIPAGSVEYGVAVYVPKDSKYSVILSLYLLRVVPEPVNP